MSQGTRLRPVSLLPSLITLGNLGCGLGAIIWVMDGAATDRPELLMYAGWLIVLAALFDAADGKLARLTRGTSDIGAQLDSLCDAITFGVAPALLGRGLVLMEGPVHEIRMHPRLLVVLPILYSCCAVLRLARFNVEHSEGEPVAVENHFKGLPSPAAAALPVALVLTYFALADPDLLLPISAINATAIQSVILRVIPFVLLLSAALMVSPLSYPHFAGWLKRTRHPFPRIAEIVLIGGLLLVEPEVALLVCSISFICFPAIQSASRRIRAWRGEPSTSRSA